MRTVLAVITCIELFLVASLGFMGVAIIYCFTRPFDSKRMVSGKALRIVAHGAALFSPIWRFKIHGELPAKLAPRTV